MMIDLTNLNWGTKRSNGLSYGCYYKANRIENGKKIYYKCSNYYAGQGLFGDESVNEVICSRFFSKLGFDCLKYTLVDANVMIDNKVFRTYVCRSENYFVGYDSRTTLEDLHFVFGGRLEDVIFNLGLWDSIAKMIIADFLVLQRDRHGGNIEILIKNGKYFLAPLFDNGLGLVAPYPSSFKTDISSFNVLFDYPVNNYIGSRSLYQNLSYIKSPIHVNKLIKSDKKSIFYGLSKALPSSYIDKIWELLVYRYMFLRKRGVIIDD